MHFLETRGRLGELSKRLPEIQTTGIERIEKGLEKGTSNLLVLAGRVRSDWFCDFLDIWFWQLKSGKVQKSARIDIELKRRPPSK